MNFGQKYELVNVGSTRVDVNNGEAVRALG